MPSRRREKKQQRFDAIVSAAAQSFQHNGHHATTIETIASEAGVSAGTVYNYFGTKNAILLAVVTRDTEHAVMEAGDAIDLSSGDPIETLMPLIMTYIDVMTALERYVVKELIGAGFDPTESAMTVELVSLDKRIHAQIRETFTRLQARDLASNAVDPDSAAILIFSVVAAAILAFASIPKGTVQDLDTTIRNQLTLAFQGIGVAE